MPDHSLRPDLFAVDTALLTRNCVIRRFREHDGKELFRIAREASDLLYTNHPQLLEMLGDSEIAAETFVRRRIADWLLQRRYTFGIWDNDSTELVGLVEIHRIDWYTPLASLRAFLIPGEGRAGQKTEVLVRVLRFGFLQLGLEKLYLTLLADNYADQRIVRKIGFSREGDLRNEHRKGSGQLADAIRFGLSRETYAE